MSDVLRVHGALTDEDGRELSHAEVRLWRRRLRERELLGEVDATEEGTYEIVADPPPGAARIPAYRGAAATRGRPAAASE